MTTGTVKDDAVGQSRSTVGLGSLHIGSLAGRCTTGQELGHGTRNHAVRGTVTSSWNELHGVALCGAKPGRRSVGWSLRDGESVTCPRCLKKMPYVQAGLR